LPVNGAIMRYNAYCFINFAGTNGTELMVRSIAAASAKLANVGISLLSRSRKINERQIYVGGMRGMGGEGRGVVSSEHTAVSATRAYFI